jgi:membrane-associated phospholipid phosphatase
MTGAQLYQFFYGSGSFNLTLFLAVNHATLPFLDVVMPGISFLGGSRLVYPYLLLLAILYAVDKRLMPARYLAVYAAATCLSLGAEALLKDFFHVPRPTAAIGLESVRVLGHVSKSFSLPSGHAVFSFMTAFVLGYGRSLRWKAPLFTCAVLVAWSRIYVGAHYPLDVAVGGGVGAACGLVVWKIWEAGERYILHRRNGME